MMPEVSPTRVRDLRSMPARRRRAQLLLGTGIAAVALVAGAIYVTRDVGEPLAAASGPLVPALSTTADSLARIEVLSGEKTVLLTRQGDTWILESAGGYPADVDAIRTLVGAVSMLERIEPLTTKKERHAELGLAWPDASGAAKLVRFVPAQGAPIEVVLGQEKTNPTSQYARNLGEDQTWRCRGAVSLDTEPSKWTTTALLTLPPEETVAISYDGLELNRVQEDGKPAQWQAILGVTPVDAVAWSDAAQTQAKSTLPSWITRFDFDDVRKRSETWTSDPRFTMTFDTVRAVVRVEGASEGDATWVRFSAEPKPDAPSADEINAKAKTSSDPRVPDWKTWNDDVAKWEYKLAPWKRGAIMKIKEPPKFAAPPPRPRGALPGASGFVLPPGG